MIKEKAGLMSVSSNTALVLVKVDVGEKDGRCLLQETNMVTHVEPYAQK